jgi:hypothetical protein
MKAGSLLFQVIALARTSGNRGSLGALSRTYGPVNLELSRNTGTRRGGLLLTPTLLSLLIQILQLREEPTPPAHELPFLRANEKPDSLHQTLILPAGNSPFILDFVEDCNFNWPLRG